MDLQRQERPALPREAGPASTAAAPAATADPVRRARRRVLLLSAPLVFIFAITDRLVLRGPAFWAAFAVRVAWGATLVGAALWSARLRERAERNVLTAVGLTTPIFFGVLAQMTGAMQSPLFHFIVAMPLVVAVVLQDQPEATLAAALAMLASGAAIVVRATRSAPALVEWAVQAAAMGGLAFYASVTYRRLRVRLDAARRAEIESAERARLYQDELKAREDFLSVASHELKTPLTSLQLQVDSLARLALDPGRPPAAADDRLRAKQEVMARQTRRLTTLVDTLLDASRLLNGKLAINPEPVELVELARQCLLSFEEDARRAGSTLELWVGRTAVDLGARGGGVAASEQIPGRWDPRRLEQILGNLLANAVRYGDGQAIQVRLAAGDQQATIAVRDQGIGIGPADHDRIFERFEQASTATASGGLGLGLWITRQLVEAMGGRVLLTSAIGEGSTFAIELPRQTASATVGIGRQRASS